MPGQKYPPQLLTELLAPHVRISKKWLELIHGSHTEKMRKIQPLLK